MKETKDTEVKDIEVKDATSVIMHPSETKKEQAKSQTFAIEAIGKHIKTLEKSPYFEGDEYEKLKSAHAKGMARYLNVRYGVPMPKDE